MNRIHKVSTTDLTAPDIRFHKMHGPPGRIETAILIGKEHSDNMSADLLIFKDTELTYVMPYDDMIYVIEERLELICEASRTVGMPRGCPVHSHRPDPDILLKRQDRGILRDLSGQLGRAD